MRSSLRTELGNAFGIERVGAWILVALAIVLAVALATGAGVTLATNAPDASFEGTYDSETNSLRIEHTGGESIRANPTSSLVVVVSDGATNEEAAVTWVTDGTHGVGTYPVVEGDEISIDDASVDSDDDGNLFDANATVGFTLDEGDSARIVWTGRPVGAPGETTRTLGTIRIADPTG